MFTKIPLIDFGPFLNGRDEDRQKFSSEIDDACRNREEAIGGNNEDSLLILFRYLSKLRQFSSFQFGLMKKEYNLQSNIFWFIREASGHRGFIIVINLNKKEKDMIHLSLYKITNNIIPEYIYYEYQWPNVYFSTLNKTSIDSDNLFIHSQSINIFSWKPRRLLKQNFI